MTAEGEQHAHYRTAGVDVKATSEALGGLLSWVSRTLDFREGAGEPLLPIGFFANAVRLSKQLSLVISMDGVGSKVMVAQLMGVYDTVGVDCVAVNVNDIICTGAEPISLVDYISFQDPHPEVLEAIGRGLHEGARRARIAIVGGELSQHRDSLTGPREGYAFDIAGTGIGLLDGRAPLAGQDIRPGDVVMGLASDGIHCNGLTLARRVLLPGGGEGVTRYLPDCGRTIGEELLRPSHIYVPEVLALLRSGVEVTGLAHISGDGLLNLNRLDANVEYRITAMPPVPPIFGVIQQEGGVGVAEMHTVFNMGVGFCVVVRQPDVDTALRVIRAAEGTAQVIGHVAAAAQRRVVIEQRGLVGEGGSFREASMD